MTSSLLLCVALLASEPAASVQAKVVFGHGPRNERQADIESWISRTVAEAGSPTVDPQSDWIVLAGDDKRLYTSAQGGFIIDGQAREKNGTFRIEINGCEGIPLRQSAALKPGERRVVQLTDNPAPNNVFIALEAAVSEQARKRIEAMKANAKSFRLDLNYHGPEDKPFYRLTVSVPEVRGAGRTNSFYRVVQISEEQAAKIIEHLARDGFFDQAVEKLLVSETGYTLKVTSGDMMLSENLGWNLAMVQRLDGVRDVLPDAGKKEMDFLLARLSGLRRQWEADQQKASLKGWELYVWRDGDETLFALLVGTNRLKTDAEIAKSAVKGFEAAKRQLGQLKKGEHVFLHGRRLLEPAPDDTAKAVIAFLKEMGLNTSDDR